MSSSLLPQPRATLQRYTQRRRGEKRPSGCKLGAIAPAPQPSPYGADRVETGLDGGIVLACPAPKAWTARVAGSQTRSEHPGTAVEWDGLLYEVREAIPGADGGFRYVLAPWEEKHAIRRMERYDAASEEQREAERRERRSDYERRRLSILLAPLAGLLPAEIQKRMERDFGASSVLMTTASALPLAIVGFLGLFRYLATLANANLDLPVWLAPRMDVALYLFLESAIRLASAIAAREPMGTVWAALGLALWRAAAPRR